MRARRGVNLVGLILLVLAMVGIGAGLMNLSQQAGRSGHWFHHSQLAHDLADAGLKQCFYLLVQANSQSAAQGQPFLAAQLQQVFQNITNGTTGEVTLFSSKAAANPPPGLSTVIQRLADFAPELVVTLTVNQPEPLWNGLLEGIPAEANEKKGSVSIVSHAKVKAPAGIWIERRITLEKAYKIINLVPPLLGRFGLFVLDGPASPDEPNVVAMKYDQAGSGSPPGNADFAGAERPLTLESTAVGALVAPGTDALDRARFVGALPADPKLLDKQGWVYLGGSAAGAWELKLAHGWGEGGESPLVPGYKPSLPTGFGGDTAGFANRFETACTANSPTGCSVQVANMNDAGLYTWFHGFADNYELITMERTSQPPNPRSLQARVQPGGTRAPLMDFGPGKTSFVRLFGDPAACSPTLVFGPVRRVMMQRARVDAYLAQGSCGRTGKMKMNLFRWGAHLPREEAIVQAAFQNQTGYEAFGTQMRRDLPFAAALAAVLSAQGNGRYATTGELLQLNAGGTDRPFASDYFDKLGNFTPSAGLDQGALDALANGKLASPLYTGDLSDGLKAFFEALKKKTTYEMKPEAFDTKVLVAGTGGGKELKIPGVILVEQSGPLKLPAIAKAEGGIIMTMGPIQIDGNISTGPAPSGQPLPEPLTLVSLKGDITIGASVTNVEAFLVALDGTVKFGGGSGITIQGGVAARKLDPANAAGPGRRKIKHHEFIDPKGRNAAVTKVFYGGEDRVMVSGTAP